MLLKLLADWEHAIFYGWVKFEECGQILKSIFYKKFDQSVICIENDILVL